MALKCNKLRKMLDPYKAIKVADSFPGPKLRVGSDGPYNFDAITNPLFYSRFLHGRETRETQHRVLAEYS